MAAFDIQLNETTYKHCVTFIPKTFQAILQENFNEKTAIQINMARSIRSKVNSTVMDIKLEERTIITPTKVNFKYKRPQIPITTLSAVANIPENTKINVQIKVLDEDDDTRQQQTASGLTRLKQKYVSDHTTWIKLSAWSDHIDHLQVGHSYETKDLRVKVFGQEKLLSTTPSTSVSEIDNIANAKTLSEPVTITASLLALRFSKYVQCVNCYTEIDACTSTTSSTTTCSSCNTSQKTSAMNNKYYGILTARDETTKQVHKLTFTQQCLFDTLEQIQNALAEQPQSESDTFTHTECETFLLQYEDNFVLQYCTDTMKITNLSTSTTD